MSSISSNYSGNALEQTATSLNSFLDDIEKLKNCESTISKYRASISEKIDAYEQFLQISKKYTNTGDVQSFQNLKSIIEDELSNITICAPTQAPPRLYDDSAPKYTISVNTVDYFIGMTNPKTGKYVTALDIAKAKMSGSQDTYSANWKSWDKIPDIEKKKIKNTSGATLSSLCGGDGSVDWYTNSITFSLEAVLKYCVPRQMPKSGTNDIVTTQKFFQDETTYTLDLISLLR